MAITLPRSIYYSQNFLRSQKLVDRLIDASSVTPFDDVVEIGPGRGIITERLARRCRRLVAIEKDRSLLDPLRRRLEGYSNVDVHGGDFLDFVLPKCPYKVFASIPFNVTAAIVGKLTSGLSPPDDAHLVVQREAALRFIGAPRMTLTSVLLRPWFEPSIVHLFRRTDFDPVPNEEVVMLRIRRLHSPLIGPENTRLFRDFVVYCFTAWQPTLASTLDRLLGRRESLLALRSVGIPSNDRPSELGLDQWLRLFDLVVNDARPQNRRRFTGSENRLQQQQTKLAKMHRTSIQRYR